MSNKQLSGAIVAAKDTKRGSQSQNIPTGELPASSGQASLHVEKEGDAIRAIRIHCACGHVTRVVCVYE